VVLSFEVDGAEVLERPSVIIDEVAPPTFLRTFNIGPRRHELVLAVAQQPNAALALLPNTAGVRFGQPTVDVADPATLSGTSHIRRQDLRRSHRHDRD
jgi:hypothetical protein